MLLLGGVIIEIAIAVAFLAYYFNTLNFSSRLATEALETARAGAQDGISKVILDKRASFSALAPYTVTTSTGRVASVTICRETCIGPGKTQVISGASVANQRKKIQAELSVDSTTGQVVVDTLKEISF